MVSGVSSQLRKVGHRTAEVRQRVGGCLCLFGMRSEEERLAPAAAALPSKLVQVLGHHDAGIVEHRSVAHVPWPFIGFIGREQTVRPREAAGGHQQRLAAPGLLPGAGMPGAGSNAQQRLRGSEAQILRPGSEGRPADRVLQRLHDSELSGANASARVK